MAVICIYLCFFISYFLTYCDYKLHFHFVIFYVVLVFVFCAHLLLTWNIQPVNCVHHTLYSWSELQVWQQGALVKHVKGLFKAEGISNAAEPGNSMHTRLYVRRLIINKLYLSTCCDSPVCAKPRPLSVLIKIVCEL